MGLRTLRIDFMQNRRSPRFRRHLPWLAVWVLVTLLAALILGQREIRKQRDQFDADLHRVHGLVSQKLLQNDALLGTLANAPNAESRARMESRLAASHPQVLGVQKREAGGSWGDEALGGAEDASAKQKHAFMAHVNLARGRYVLVQAALPTSLALQLDLRSQIAWIDWPMVRETSPVQVRLEIDRQYLNLQDGNLPTLGARGWSFDFRRPLDSASQPFILTAQRHLGWSELPWSAIVNVSLLAALLLLATRALLRQRHDMARARELMHMGEVGRLNTMNELAAGMAKELGGPIEAAQAAANQARAHLSDDSQEPLVALLAIDAAVDHLKNANSVVTRLRHVVEEPDLSHQLVRVSLHGAAKVAVDLLQPELTRQGVAPVIELAGEDFLVLAQVEALQHIIFQLITNALQAMQGMRAQERSLTLLLASAERMGHLTVQDNGPGIANNVATKIFEPFFTTRPGHLGLGLSQCETLASSMGGTLTAFNRVPRGAEFCLSLRLAG
jgi:signal transduction histidine kinase